MRFSRVSSAVHHTKMPVVAIGLTVLFVGCGVFGGTADGDPGTTDDPGPLCDDDREWTPGADNGTEYADFVELEAGQFVHAQHNVGVLDEPDLGRVVAEVCLELSEVTFTGPFDIQVGDAAYLDPGTELREIVGADPSLRLGAVVDGRVQIFELWDPPNAVIGGQVIDLGVNVDEITLNRSDGVTVVASISEPDAVDSLVTAVRTAPVDRPIGSEESTDEPEFVLEFRRSDGTSTRRRYRPSTGRLASIILLPEETQSLLGEVVAEIDPEIAAGAIGTEGSTTTTVPSPTASTTPADGDPGLLPAPTNEAEGALRFDFGAIVGTSNEGGVSWIQFDRYQLGDGINGPELTTEVRIEGATDLGWVNENSRFRWYRLAPDVEVLELEADWFNRLCDGEPVDYEFVPSSLNRLLTLDARLVSLTFADREVVRIRDQRSC